MGRERPKWLKLQRRIFHQTRLKDTHTSIKMDAGHIMELCMYVGRWNPLIRFSGGIEDMIFDPLLGPIDRYNDDDIGGIEENHDYENDGRYFTKLLFEQSH